MNLEDVDFVKVVEEIQKIEWPKRLYPCNYTEKLADIVVSGSKVPPVQVLAGLLMAEFVDEAMRIVHGDDATQFVEAANVEIVLEEAHPDMMRGILAKIKEEILTTVPLEQWKKYGGY